MPPGAQSVPRETSLTAGLDPEREASVSEKLRRTPHRAKLSFQSPCGFGAKIIVLSSLIGSHHMSTAGLESTAGKAEVPPMKRFSDTRCSVVKHCGLRSGVVIHMRGAVSSLPSVSVRKAGF